MNILYASDDNYAEVMGISILSLLDNNSNCEKIDLFVVNDHIQEINIVRLQNIAKQFGRKITFIPKPNIHRLAGTAIKTLRWSDSAFSRLFLRQIFADYPHIERILYLDCDTLIVDSLERLWSCDLGGYLGAAVLECMSNMHKRILGADKKDNYINTGVMLIDVKQWIEKDIESMASDFIRRHGGKIEYVDQGVINGTISSRLKIVDPRYNMTALGFDFTYEEMIIYRKPEFGYTKQEFEAAVKNPAVVHFTTSFLSIRPWIEGSRQRYADRWRKYHELSPWKDFAPRADQRSNLKKLLPRLYLILPRNIAIRLAGIMHAYVKPLKYLM